MGLKALKFFFAIVLVAYWMPQIHAKPKDSTVFENQNVVRPDDVSPLAKTGVKADNIQGSTYVFIYGVVITKGYPLMPHILGYTPQMVYGPLNTFKIKFSGRIRCESLEAEEDPVCQEHCLPKGYTYGVCVSQICTCI